MNLKSRILQFINRDLMIELNSIALDVLIPDNNTKVNLMIAALDKYNIPYSELGPGTNRFSILIDGYVFKIGMDKAGIVDNWMEFSLSQELQPFVTKCYECNGLIAVEEYVTVISKEEFLNNKEEVRQILSHLAEGYLLGDVGSITKNFMNWGYRNDGSLVILDYGYIYRVIGEELKCEGLNKDDTICDGILEYDENFNKLICPVCGKVYTFHEIRRKISKEYEEKELAVIKEIAYKVTKPSQTISTNDQSVMVNASITNNVEGEKAMRNDYYDQTPEIDENTAYEEAIEFMMQAHNRMEKVSEKIDQGEDIKPLIKDFYMVEETAENMGDDEETHITTLDEEDEDEDDGISVEELFDIIDTKSNIEEENDELEEETGIPDEELNSKEEEVLNETSNEKIQLSSMYGEIGNNNEEIPQEEVAPLVDSDEGEIISVDEAAEDVVEGTGETFIEDDTANDEQETTECHCDEEVETVEETKPTEVTIEIPGKSDNIVISETTPLNNSATSANIKVATTPTDSVKIEVNNDVTILTTSDNVDKMRALLAEDIKNQEEEDNLIPGYEKFDYDESFHKIPKSKKRFEE